MVSGLLSLALVVAVVAVAYGSQAPSLSVAEFAPAANQRPEAPPTTQGDQGGDSAGRGDGRRSTSTTLAAAATTAPPDASGSSTPTTRVGRGRLCVGNPPRQTEDPMSPPCVATIFEGDNGGATTKGVSATEIRIGVPSGWSSTERTGVIDALFAHMNQKYEFYGRRLVPVHTTGSASTPTDARARAAELASMGIFAGITGSAEWNAAHAALPLEWARQGVVTVVRNGNSWWSDRTMFDAAHPYIWSVYQSLEDQEANLASFACSTLAGDVAAFAGDVGLRTSTRKFGVVTYGRQAKPSTSTIESALGACTGDSPTMGDVTGGDTNSRRAAIERLEAAGVTTIICVCESSSGTAMSAAHSSGYHPEWIVTPGNGATNNDEHTFQSSVASGQSGPPIRFGPGPKLLPIQARPWYQALQGFLPTATDIYTTLSMGEVIYDQLLVLASGIQGAGPQLTPDSFSQALMSTQFPNTGAGQAPFWQPSAGFGPGDHSLYDDYNIAWWSPEAEALDIGLSSNPRGSWCYMQQGARYEVGKFPAGGNQLLFNAGAPCR